MCMMSLASCTLYQCSAEQGQTTLVVPSDLNILYFEGYFEVSFITFYWLQPYLCPKLPFLCPKSFLLLNHSRHRFWPVFSDYWATDNKNETWLCNCSFCLFSHIIYTFVYKDLLDEIDRAVFLLLCVSSSVTPRGEDHWQGSSPTKLEEMFHVGLLRDLKVTLIVFGVWSS